MSRKFSDFESEDSPIGSDHLVGYRSTSAGGERRFTLSNLLKFFGILDSGSSGSATDGQVLTADGLGGAAWEDNAANVGVGTGDELVDAAANGDVKSRIVTGKEL